jgi:hypothetical protein
MLDVGMNGAISGNVVADSVIYSVEEHGLASEVFGKCG